MPLLCAMLLHQPAGVPLPSLLPGKSQPKVFRKESDGLRMRSSNQPVRFSCSLLIGTVVQRLEIPRAGARQMPPTPVTPRRAAASHPLLPVLPPRVTGAVNICTGPDKEKANRVPLFMGLGSRLLGQLRSISVLAAPQLGLSPAVHPGHAGCSVGCYPHAEERWGTGGWEAKKQDRDVRAKAGRTASKCE